MVRITQLNVCMAALLVAFVVSGCQSNKFLMTWKERSKPKPNFQGLEGPDEVAYWPYKVDKSSKKPSPMPDQLKEKLAKKSEIEKRDSQLADLMKEGDQLSANGQFEDARLVYMRSLMVSPGNPSIHHRLAVVADKQRQYSVADEHYQAALRQRPRDVNILSDLGFSYVLRDNLPQAERTLKQALEIDRSHQRAMANMGLVYAKQNRRDEALAMFREGATEAEAQQFMATIFSQNNIGSGLAAAANSNAGASLADTQQRRPQDLKGLTVEQIQSVMSREAQEAKRKRYEADQRELQQARNVQKLDEEWSGQPAPNRVVAINKMDQNARPGQGYPSQLDVQGASYAQNGVTSPEGPVQNLAGVTLYPSTSGPATTNVAVDQNAQMAVGQVMTGQPSAGGSQAPFVIERGQSSLAQTQRSRPLESLAQRPRGQYSMLGGPNGTRSVPTGDNASQLATQLGMSAGPGSLFPMVNGATNESPAAFGNPAPASPVQGAQPTVVAPAGMPAFQGASMAAPAHSFDTRFGGEFQQAASFQSQNKFAGNPIQQAGDRSMSNPTQPERTDVGPAIAPASPSANWGSPSNWQSGSSDLPSWANQQPTTGAAGTGLDSNAGQSTWAQDSDRRLNTIDAGTMNNQSQNRDQTPFDASRPYSGSWPANANALPNRAQPNVIINGRASNGFDNQFAAPINNQPGTPTQNGSAGSVPQWPYTPK